MYWRDRTLTRKRPTPWRWPPVRSFTFANVLRLVLGLWVLNSPMVSPELSVSDAATQNLLVVGGCVAGLAALRMIFVQEAGIFRWAHLLLGLWTIASPWIFDYASESAALLNSAVCGTLIAVLALWSLVR